MADSGKQKDPPPDYHPPASSGSAYPPPTGPSGGSQPMGYAPQPSGYTPGPSGYPATTTVMMTQPGMPAAGATFFYRENPAYIVCQYCQATVTTSTIYETSILTWLLCIGCVILGCWLLCYLIPFCIDACKDVEHRCPNCQRTVGHYRRL